MVISYPKVSNAALGLLAAGSVAVADSAADSKVALLGTAVESKVALLGTVAAAEVLAPPFAILRLKLPNRELAAPKHWFGASTGQAVLN